MEDDDLNKDDEISDIENAEGGAEEEPLNSEDDVTDEDAADLFETDNVVVCQYDKVKISAER
jgi:transcription initiation factor TFIIA large subunit